MYSACCAPNSNNNSLAQAFWIRSQPYCHSLQPCPFHTSVPYKAKIEDMELERKIKKYRWDLNNFATQLSRDVRYGKDQFDIIFQEHEEYESLLREHNMTNGQTTIAMDIIRKYYKKLYFDGNNQN